MIDKYVVQFVYISLLGAVLILTVLNDNYYLSLPVRHWKENLPTDLDGNSFQSNSLSILVLFLETETFLLINKQKHLFVITWISNQIYS